LGFRRTDRDQVFKRRAQQPTAG